MESSIVSPLRLVIAECLPSINNVIFNNPATIVFWKYGTKTVVKYQKETGVVCYKRLIYLHKSKREKERSCA